MYELVRTSCRCSVPGGSGAPDPPSPPGGYPSSHRQSHSSVQKEGADERVNEHPPVVNWTQSDGNTYKVIGFAIRQYLLVDLSHSHRIPSF
ncbi:unnamed protein product [Soboliphyme baturini]|uniref:F5/8 type C domain-containing protein n=1 Tax=Soboliphyme baturini TaxID=241478 RepID=A0A183IDW7_9BILA|nr:unnamed protein product [Soboliphyme baturini]